MKLQLFSFKSKKRGIIALEALVGTLLSIIALIFLFNVFAKVIFLDSDNEKIAEQNLNSIANFIEFSDNKYSHLNSCYSVLKFNALENHQFEEEGQNYFYIITKDYVGIARYEYYEDFFNLKEGYSNKLELKRSFDKKLNLVLDKTNSGWFFDSQKLELEYDQNIILIKPIYNKEQKYEIIIVGELGLQNIAGSQGSVIEDYNRKEIESMDLIFEPIKGNLFFSNSELSKYFIENKLCFKEDFLFDRELDFIGDDFTKIFENPELLKKYYFKLSFDKKPENYFIIDEEFSCYENNKNVGCYNMLGINPNSLGVFGDLIKRYVINNDFGNLYIEEKKLIIRESKKIEDNLIKHEEDLVLKHFDSWGVKEKSESLFYSFGGVLGTKNNIKNVVYYENGILYFYYKDGFYRFNHEKIKNIEGKYFFEGEEINYEAIYPNNLDIKNNIIPAIKIEEFKFENGEKIDIYMSNFQWRYGE